MSPAQTVAPSGAELLRTAVGFGTALPPEQTAELDAAIAARVAELALSIPTMRWFTYHQLPTFLRHHSRPFAVLAIGVCERGLASEGQRDLALTHLLISKDAAVRAALS